MPSSLVEREVKLDVPADFSVPDLGQLLPEGGSVETVVEELRSDYFDTADRALLRARMTLRRRTGTADTGWQLKVPHKPFREEIRVGDTGEQVPDELAVLLAGIGSEFSHLATVATTRSVTRLLDADGRALAEVDDDAVRAWGTAQASEARTWREVEVELADGDLPLLDALTKRLRKAGARSSDSASKLGRALGVATAEPRLRTVGDVVSAYLAQQQRVLLAGDLALRRGNADAIHRTRVATRRFRSTLRVFADVFAGPRAAKLDGELAWFAGVLGEVRDRQVLRARYARLAGEEFPDAAAALDALLAAEQQAAWEAVGAALTSARYAAVLAEVDAFTRGAPLAKAAGRRAAAIRRPVRAAERTVVKRLRRANRDGDIDELHAARKAAKRARYAAEAGEVVLGDSAHRRVKRYQALQDLLGEHQDSVVSAEVLQRLAADTVHTAELGALLERERAAAKSLRKQARTAAKSLG